jgi:hypothetical protein
MSKYSTLIAAMMLASLVSAAQADEQEPSAKPLLPPAAAEQDSTMAPTSLKPGATPASDSKQKIPEGSKPGKGADSGEE